MAIRNEFEFRSALLTALGQEHTEAEAKNEETWRRKMLDGLGVEYNQNDVNQFGLFREKLVEGVENYSGGGGGSSDFSTAEVTLIVGSVSSVRMEGACIIERGGVDMIRTAYVIEENTTSVTQAVLYQGTGFVMIDTEATVSVSGNIQELSTGFYSITGDCTITIS